MATTTRPPLDDPQLLPYLPFIYLAWSDGTLTSDEINGICAEFSAAEGIEADCQSAFAQWLTPDVPPHPDDLKAMLDQIRSTASSIDQVADFDLEELADALASSGRSGASLTAGERHAVRRLSEQLGMVGTEPTRFLLGSPAIAIAPDTEAPHLDVTALTKLREGTRQATKDRVRTLLTEPLFAHAPRATIPELRQHTLDQTLRLAEAGIGRLGFPAEQGGEGGQTDFLAAFSAIAHHDLGLVTKFGVQFGLFAGAIMRLGTERHHAAYLPGAISMDLVGCFAMTETGHGSDVQRLETTATFDPIADTFVINTPHAGARKDYIGNAASDATMAVVFAQLITGGVGYGVHAFVVPIRDSDGNPMPGVTIGDDGPKTGLNGVDNGWIVFENVAIPRDDLLNRFASVGLDGTYSSDIPGEGKRFFTTIGTLVGGRIGVGSAAISAAETALTIAVRYGETRTQFGPDEGPETALLDYPHHQRRLMPLLATTYAYRVAFEHLIDDYDQERLPTRELEGHAAGLKAFGTWHGNRTIQECREACGGAGYLAENRMGPLKADADVLQTYEGDNTVLAQLVARGLLSSYAQQFNDMNLLGTIRFVASRAIETVRDANPLVLGGAGENDLRDPDRYVDLFRWREDDLVATLGARLKNRIDAGMDSTAAFTEVQSHGIAAAKAHVEHLVLRRFVSAVAAAPAGAERDALQVMCDLYALSHLESDRAWFAEHGKLSASASKALRDVVSKLCAELRTMAVPLVDAFAIPDEVIGAPIGLKRP